jgi:Protein of unknown function (DUF2934)
MSEKIAKFPNLKPDIGSQELTEEYIRLRAYQRYEQRGLQHGYALEDWVEAEAQIFGRKHESASAKGESARATAA